MIIIPVLSTYMYAHQETSMVALDVAARMNNHESAPFTNHEIPCLPVQLSFGHDTDVRISVPRKFLDQFCHIPRYAWLSSSAEVSPLLNRDHKNDRQIRSSATRDHQATYETSQGSASAARARPAASSHVGGTIVELASRPYEGADPATAHSEHV